LKFFWLAVFQLVCAWANKFQAKPEGAKPDDLKLRRCPEFTLLAAPPAYPSPSEFSQSGQFYG
jgi:hypothetical protein